MKKQILAVALVAGVLSPLFAFGNVANASTKATLKTSVSYNDGKINFKGSASNADVKKVVIKHGSESFTTKAVKAKNFSVAKAFDGKGAFHIYGTNKAGKKVTKSYTIGTSKYTTNKPVYYSVDRSDPNTTKVRIYDNGEKNVTFRAYYNGNEFGQAYAAKGGLTMNFNHLPDGYDLQIDAVAKNKIASAKLIIPQVENGKGLSNPEILPF
ncbi:hypothetical protein ACYATP_07335 [Lactobacillaceae bacterium Melli_B4]